MRRARQLLLDFKPRGRPPRIDRADANVAAAMHRVRAPIDPRVPIHLVLKLAPPRRLRFRDANRVVRGVLRAIAATRASFRVLAYSLLDDHLHLIVESDDHAAFVSGARSLSIRIARRLNPVLGRKGRLVAEVYFRRELRTPREVHRALRYVLLNHRKHVAQAGAPAHHPLIDPFSSAGWFDGWSMTIAPDPEPSVITPAQTWLARVGWRRYGLLSPYDIPG